MNMAMVGAMMFLVLCLSLTSLALAEDPKRLRFFNSNKQPQETTTSNEKFLRQTAPAINYIGEDGPFGLCEGDCDDDGDCPDELECFSRDELESVPGCSGAGGVTDTREGADICYDPNTLAPSQTPSAAPSNLEPTVSPAPTSMPSSTPTAAPTGAPTSYPTRTTLFEVVSGNSTGAGLGKCEGECQEDEDCRGDLRCQKRGGTEFVPGCDGMGASGVNYCYDKNDGIPPPSMPDGSFRLRLYWESGFYWQETNRETKWCLKTGNPPEIRSCGSGSKYQFVYVPGIGDMIKVDDESKCLTLVSARALAFEDCDESDINQRWLGNWAARRFDIRSAKTLMCASNHHHPKSGEVVYLNDCKLAHMTNTGFWNVER